MSTDPWESTREHPEDYRDWKYLTSNGDTLLGFTDWQREHGGGSTFETDAPLFTVVGFWGSDGERHVTGVIAGDHQVTGGTDTEDTQPFAVLVNAEDENAAEKLVEGSNEDTEGIQ